jgi:hypothetical protein
MLGGPIAHGATKNAPGDADVATGNLIDARPDATVFTAGDNAYPCGTLADYQTEYDPAWGAFKVLGRRRDLVTDRGRTITRLREALVSSSPALERALDLNCRGPLTLLTHYQSPMHLRRAGHKRIATYLETVASRAQTK